MPTGIAQQPIQPESLGDYLEIMTKAVFQSGMSWKVVEAKWPSTREAFHGFEINKVAALTTFDLEALANDSRVIRNRRKLDATISNARQMLALDKEFGSFQAYLRSHGDFDATLKALRKDFKFMGPTGTYFFLYMVGEEVPTHEEFEAAYR